MSNLTIRMTIDSNLLQEGQVVLKSTLENTTDAAIVFLPWNTPFESRLKGRFLQIYQVTDSGLIEIPYEGIMIKRGAPQETDYIRVVDGQLYESSVDLTKSYTFCADQAYILKYEGPLYGPNAVSIEVEGVSVEFTTSEKFPNCH